MPISQRSPSAQISLAGRHSEQGFTLIELLVVLAILSLAAVLFVGVAGAPKSPAREDLAALESEIGKARQLAMQTGQVQQVVLVQYGAVLKPQIGGVSDRLSFHADGSSNGGVILRDRKEFLKIRWIDGRIIP